MIKKGIHYGCGITSNDFNKLSKNGITTLFLRYNEISKMEEEYKTAIKNKFTDFIIDVSSYNWRDIVDRFDGDYYVDEPFSVRTQWYIKNKNMTEKEARLFVFSEMIERRDYVKQVRPNRKFIIGDIREFIKHDYAPIKGVWYTYTSYTDTMFLFGKPMPFGFPNQSRAIRRLYKQVNGKVAFIWMFGKNKLLCHPDEYHKLFPLMRELNIPLAMLYSQSGHIRYMHNDVDSDTAWRNVFNFINEQKPYTFWYWWRSFFRQSYREIVYLITGNKHYEQ